MKTSGKAIITVMFLVFVFIVAYFSVYTLMDSGDTVEEIKNAPQNTSKKIYENEVLNTSKKIYKNTSQNTLIRIFKKERLLELYVDGQLFDKFKISLGSSPIGDKNKEGDGKTPVGKYYICTRNDKSRFTLFLGISYPNTEDARRGLENELIDQKIFEKIKQANDNEIQPPWNTPLGGAVGIHGGGNTTDWTWGCISLSEKDIKTLWKYAKLKTPVEIYE